MSRDKTILGGNFEQAMLFAAMAHLGQYRKGTEIPYISHVLQVAGIALEHGADEEQAIAALLHDVIEDTRITEAHIAARFGDRVARIVRECSDAEGPDKKPPWCERKEAYLERLATADSDTALVSCADKLHNARSIVMDIKQVGAEAFERFKGKRDGTLWYYQQLAGIFTSPPVPKALLREFQDAVQAMHERG